MPSTPAKQDSALRAVLARLVAIEAAMTDLRGPDITYVDRDALEDPIYKERYANRVRMAVFHLAHLSDDVKRLAKRRGIGVASLETVLDSSQAIRITRKLTNSEKHGLGGRDAGATVLNGFLTVHKRPKGTTETERRILVQGMLVVDAAEGVFPSSTLLPTAVRHWGNLLTQIFGIDDVWVRRIVPQRPTPFVKIEPGQERKDVPLGSVILMELPSDLSTAFQSDARKRGQDA